ncbi:MAG: hypothetical protein ACREOZ_04420 [Gloeomargaritales cyanobacterium]
MKTILALIDIALTNTAIHYFLANPSEGRQRDDARAEFMQSIADAMIDPERKWATYSSSKTKKSLSNDLSEETMDDEEEEDEDEVLLALGVTPVPVALTEETVGCDRSSTCCEPTSFHDLDKLSGNQIKRFSKTCQVCIYEERKLRQKDVIVCQSHGVRLCLRSDPPRSEDEPSLKNIETGVPLSDWSWICPNTSDSCCFKIFIWKKAFFLLDLCSKMKKKVGMRSPIFELDPSCTLQR